jgi:hypothetical protein
MSQRLSRSTWTCCPPSPLLLASLLHPNALLNDPPNTHLHSARQKEKKTTKKMNRWGCVRKDTICSH